MNNDEQEIMRYVISGFLIKMLDVEELKKVIKLIEMEIEERGGGS